MSGIRFDKYGHAAPGFDPRVDELIGYGMDVAVTGDGGWCAFEPMDEWPSRDPIELYAMTLDGVLWLARQAFAPAGETKDFHFTVTVSTQSLSKARQVMAERLGHDEDYGFDYTIDYDDNN